MPTETVYGLAGMAFDETALARIFKTKERPQFDPLILHMTSQILGGPPFFAGLVQAHLIDLQRLGPAARVQAERLLRTFWPGPLTVVLPKRERVPDLATSGLDTVALRMPRHPVAQALINAAGQPLAAPSANRFGKMSPTSAQDVMEELGDRIDFILDGGPTDIGLESTIIEIAPEGGITLLRAGGLPIEKIEAIAAAPVQVGQTVAARAEGSGIKAPGGLPSHYAPQKILMRLPAPVSRLKTLADFWNPAESLPEHLGLLTFSRDLGSVQRAFAHLTGRKVTAVGLSTRSDDTEAARNFFSALRALDRSEASLLFVEPCMQSGGLWDAIADRIRRASSQRG